MKSYLITLAAIVFGTFAAVSSLGSIGILACMKCDLLRYQESKIAVASDVDTVFLGDSKSGYALDANEFSAISARNTLNLALTGYNYGIGGAYSLLNELLLHTQPKNVVFSFTPQTFAHSIATLHDVPMQGFVQSARRNPQLLFSIGPKVSAAVTAMVSAELHDKQFMIDGIDFLRGDRPPLPAYFPRYDYLEPGTRKLDLKTVEIVNLGRAPHDYDAFFRNTGELCQAK